MKNKYIAAALAFFFGWLGAHKFYLNKPIQGILHFIFGPIGYLIAFIEAFQYLTMSDDAFDVRHNMKNSSRLLVKEKQEVYREKLKLEKLRLQNQYKTEKAKMEKKKIPVKKITGEQADELAAWHDLMNQGIIDEQQFEEKRRIILGLDN